MASGATAPATSFYSRLDGPFSPFFLRAEKPIVRNFRPCIYPIARYTDFARGADARSSLILSEQQIRPAKTNLLSEEGPHDHKLWEISHCMKTGDFRMCVKFRTCWPFFNCVSVVQLCTVARRFPFSSVAVYQFSFV